MSYTRQENQQLQLRLLTDYVAGLRAPGFPFCRRTEENCNQGETDILLRPTSDLQRKSRMVDGVRTLDAPYYSLAQTTVTERSSTLGVFTREAVPNRARDCKRLLLYPGFIMTIQEFESMPFSVPTAVDFDHPDPSAACSSSGPDKFVLVGDPTQFGPNVMAAYTAAQAHLVNSNIDVATKKGSGWVRDDTQLQRIHLFHNFICVRVEKDKTIEAGGELVLRPYSSTFAVQERKQKKHCDACRYYFVEGDRHMHCDVCKRFFHQQCTVGDLCPCCPDPELDRYIANIYKDVLVYHALGHKRVDVDIAPWCVPFAMATNGLRERFVLAGTTTKWVRSGLRRCIQVEFTYMPEDDVVPSRAVELSGWQGLVNPQVFPLIVKRIKQAERASSFTIDFPPEFVVHGMRVEYFLRCMSTVADWMEESGCEFAASAEQGDIKSIQVRLAGSSGGYARHVPLLEAEP